MKREEIIWTKLNSEVWLSHIYFQHKSAYLYLYLFLQFIFEEQLFINIFPSHAQSSLGNKQTKWAETSLWLHMSWCFEISLLFQKW